MPNTRPRIVFDDEGICNACRNAEEKDRIDWDARRQEFLDYVDRLRPSLKADVHFCSTEQPRKQFDSRRIESASLTVSLSVPRMIRPVRRIVDNCRR